MPSDPATSPTPAGGQPAPAASPAAPSGEPDAFRPDAAETSAVDPAPSTAAAPSFRSTARPRDFGRPFKPADLPEPGHHIDDFEIRTVLGEGSFGKVYLALQVSLDRLVALKVTANRGSEARTMASLEHDHIVQVFSEAVEPQRDLRLLCMQYVAGTGLDRVISNLAHRDRDLWTGRALLDIIDLLSVHTATLDPAALRDRELLADCDFFEAVCWIGARLAEALGYAHRQGVLHRDIKPANILLNQYGRPMLADFSLSLHPSRVDEFPGKPFGGTLGYMAPEHLDACNPATDVTPDAVDQRSDIYSLGVVLFELLTAVRPFVPVRAGGDRADSLRAMADQERAGAPSPRLYRSDVPDVLDRIVRRCLAPDPDGRYQTATELAEALEGARALHHAVKELPPPGLLTRAALKHPFAWIVGLVFLPNLLGSAVNISYNALRIVSGLTPAQQTTFNHVVLVYNVVVYPFCFWIIWRLVTPIYRARRQLAESGAAETAALAAVRRRLISVPFWAVGLACLGWLPGGILFPLAIDRISGPVSFHLYLHFFASFTISGLISLTYSFFTVAFIAIRVLYPALWADGRNWRHAAVEELGWLPPRIRFFQLLAGLIPLSGAALMVGVGQEHLTKADYATFRFLVTALIALGMAGVGLAVAATSFLTQTLTILVAAKPRASAAAPRWS